MAKLADAIQQHNVRRYAQCSIAVLLGQLSKPDAADLRAALDNPAIVGSAISNGLKSLGHPVSGLTVQRHRRGACACPR